MVIKIKKLNDKAIIPKYASEGAACFDLTAVSININRMTNQVTYGTGLAFEIPKGYKGLLYPRSSIIKTSVRLANCLGVIDSDYRGEVTCVFDEVIDSKAAYYQIGDRICQMEIVPVEQVEFEEVNELDSTKRGSGSYGSTGK